MKDAQKIRIQFNSKEYFDFAAQLPDTRAWLALGQNVQFVRNGIVYEIYE